PPATRLRFHLLEALPHRDSFLVRESCGLLSGRRSALGRLLQALLCRFHSAFLSNEVCITPSCSVCLLGSGAHGRQSEIVLWLSNIFSSEQPSRHTSCPTRPPWRSRARCTHSWRR